MRLIVRADADIDVTTALDVVFVLLQMHSIFDYKMLRVHLVKCGSQLVPQVHEGAVLFDVPYMLVIINEGAASSYFMRGLHSSSLLLDYRSHCYDFHSLYQSTPV